MSDRLVNDDRKEARKQAQSAWLWLITAGFVWWKWEWWAIVPALFMLMSVARWAGMKRRADRLG